MPIFKITRLSFMVALLLMVGCKSVSTAAITGTPSVNVAQAIQGLWKFNDTILLAKALDNGQLMFGRVDWKKEQWQVGQRIVTVTDAGDHKLFFLGTSKPPEGQDENTPLTDQPDEKYMFLKLLFIGKEPDTLIAYVPDADTFAKAIAAGKLKGDIEKDSKGSVQKVALNASSEELEKFIKDTPTHELFLMQSPMVLERVK